ncbi:MAG: ribonuclease III domain-containing protein [Methanofollis sp.]|nr:ribonuclease III domain-containing protein [Methanofollis sp.]
MHQTLRWHTVGVEQNLQVLRDGLFETRASLQSGKHHAIEKMGHWISSLDIIIEQMAAVGAEVRPRVETDLGYGIRNHEMFAMIFFQPSTRNLFSEVAVHFNDGSCSLSQEKLTELASLPDAAETLAWIGDAALKIGVLREIWSPRPADAGKLSERRKEYESNANMARLADRWGLYEHRIQFDPHVRKKTTEIEHIKGTLVEGVFGIVFLQGGLEGVASAATFLRP